MTLLERNVEAIQGWTPSTAAQVAGAAVPAGFEVVAGTDGTPTYRRIVEGGAAEGAGRRVEWLGGTSMPRASAWVLTDTLDVGTVNGLGLSIGTGHEWAAFAGKLPSSLALYVYEPEAGYLRMALEVCDLSDLLRTGKLLLFTGPLAGASDELSRVVASHLGLEPPTVLHPLPTMGPEKRNALLSAGEAIVRRVVTERMAQVNTLATQMEEATRTVSTSEIACLVTPRYALERPVSGAIGGAARVLYVDQHASTSLGLRLKAFAEVRPQKIIGDFYRGQIGCVPGHVEVETWIPPLIGAGYWDRLPAAGTLGEKDRVIVHGAWQVDHLAARGISGERVQLRPLVRGAVRHSTQGQERHRVALIGDLPLVTPEALGVELPTHLAVLHAAFEMIRDEYLTVHAGSETDLLRRALQRAGVQVEQGSVGMASDPALREPMLRIIREVLIPTLPLVRLAEVLMEQGVPLRLVGEWPGVAIPGGSAVATTAFPQVTSDGAAWQDVAVAAHLSPTGMVSPLLLDAAAAGVAIVSSRHATDGWAGSLATLFTPEKEYAAPSPQQLVPTIKALIRDAGRREKLVAQGAP